MKNLFTTSIKVSIFTLLMALSNVNANAAQLKLATVAPEGSPWMNAMRAGAEEIEQRTDGRIKFKFYGGGVMGNEASVTRKIRIGQLHGGAFTSGGLGRIYDGMNIYATPFLFDSAEEAAYVREQMDEQLYSGLKEKGFIGLGMAQGGFGKLMSANKMQSLDDLKGKKLWVPEDDDLSFELMRDLGLSPVKLPLTDVLTGLQTQLLEIVGSSAIGAIALQWHTKVKYVLDQPLVFIYGTLVIDQRYFGKLSAGDQAIVKEVFGKVYKKIDTDNYLDNKKAEQALRDNGVSFESGNPAEVAKIVAHVRAQTDALAEKNQIPKELYIQAKAHIKTFRAQSGANPVKVASPE